MPKVPARQSAVNDPAGDSGVRTPAGDAFSELVVRLFRVNGLIAAEGDALARPAGQSTARWQVLAAVEKNPATVAQIARMLGLARQSVQRVADSLEATGLVRYDDNPRHRRARLVALTAAGRSALTAIQAAQRPWANALGGSVGERNLGQLNALLDKVLVQLARRRAR